MQPRVTILATDTDTVNIYITLNKSQVAAQAYLWSLDSSLHPQTCPLAFLVEGFSFYFNPSFLFTALFPDPA